MSRLARAFPILALLLAAVAGAGLLIAGPGFRLGWWPLGTGFALVRWSAPLALAAGAIAVAGGLASAARRRWTRLSLALLALLVALPVFWVPWRLQAQARRAPPIHDVTTDLDDPPAFVAVLGRRHGAPNPVEYGGPEVAAQQRRAYPDLVPLDLAVPPERIVAAAEAAARDLGWEIVATAPGEGRLEATATTRWFGFKDDIVVRVRPRGAGSRVDVRSLSRVGRGDLGVNAARIRAFLTRLRARGLPAAG